MARTKSSVKKRQGKRKRGDDSFKTPQPNKRRKKSKEVQLRRELKHDLSKNGSRNLKRMMIIVMAMGGCTFSQIINKTKASKGMVSKWIDRAPECCETGMVVDEDRDGRPMLFGTPAEKDKALRALTKTTMREMA